LGADPAWTTARQEAEMSFGDGSLFLEEFIEN